jgi:hypothetical protein
VSNIILRFCCCKLAITFNTEFTLFGAAAIDKHASEPELLCIKLFSMGKTKFKPSKCSVIAGASASFVAAKHVSKAPKLEIGPFTCFLNSSRMAK